MSDYLKYNVPEFDPSIATPPTTYTWWSWHPTSFSKWTKSCWRGSTIEEAMAAIKWPPHVEAECGEGCHKLDYYHNKLIKHSIKGYEEVFDLPCKRTDLWDKCIERENKQNDD